MAYEVIMYLKILLESHAALITLRVLKHGEVKQFVQCPSVRQQN